MIGRFDQTIVFVIFINGCVATKILGESVRSDKAGEIPNELQSILHRLDINDKEWMTGATQFEGKFRNMVGQVEKMKAVCLRTGRNWLQGMKACQSYYRTKPA